MKNKKVQKLFLVIALVAALGGVMPMLSSCFPGKPAAPPAAAKTVNIGALMAMTGPAAAWGLPGLPGMHIVIDSINEAGGLKVGDERYLVNLVTYDDENIASKAVLGANKLVFEDKVKFIIMLGDPPVSAVSPFLNEQKVIYDSLYLPLAKDRPYLIAGNDIVNWGDALRAYWLAQNQPIKRAAVVVQDDICGMDSGSWSLAGWKSAGVDVVYDKRFALDTVDFAPVMSAILETNPDVIDCSCAYPEYVVLLEEQAYLQGFEGIFTHCDSDLLATLAKVPAEWLAGRHYEDVPSMNDPWFGEGSPQHQFYDAWMARYGPGAPEDQHRKIYAVEVVYPPAIQMWAYGVEHAGTFDSDAVLAAMKAAKEVPSIEGPLYWLPEIGEDLFGIDNLYAHNFHVTCLQPNGDRKCVAEMDFEPWYKEYRDLIIQEREAMGLMYYQR
jgi:branched-chain amino acid transport system substrate-binding protein